MKNNTIVAMALLFSAAANAQNPITTTDSSHTITAGTSTEIYTDLKGVTSETLRPEHSFPILGSYKASGSASGDVAISLDETNKGIVWISGLLQGKFKAYMKKSPATYKIPAQKTENGKAVAEGTLFLNPQSKELTIVLGRPFNDEDPTSFLTNASKSKLKPWIYTGIKSDANVMAPSSHQ